MIGVIDLEKELEERLCIPEPVSQEKYREALSRKLILGSRSLGGLSLLF